VERKGVSVIAIVILVIVIAVVGVGVYFLLKGGGPSGTESYGIVMGKVTDTAGSVVGNATVSVGGQSAATNDQGWFSISNVAAGSRVLATFSKNGYVITQRTAEVRVGSSSFLDVTMAQASAAQSLDATTGGAITQSSGSVNIGANSLVDAQGNSFTGTASVSVTPFDPTVESARDVFPGNFAGLVNGEEMPFESYGFMDVTVTGSGLLQLASGKTATIEIPIPATKVASAPNTIDLWYYDTADGYWKNEGTATKVGSVYRGTVSHFSDWNADFLYDLAYITGRVVNAEGTPQVGATVVCDGVDYSSRREATTGTDGRFRAVVKPNSSVRIWASKGGISSTPTTVATPTTAGGEEDVGDIVLTPPIVQITLTWGENPRDLDSHLAARLSSGENFHVYYSSKGSLTLSPYVTLDTDDTTSYGPEVISISRLSQGTYRYSVRHYAGDGTIATSSAEINAIIEGVGIYRYTPPAGQAAGTDIWRVIDIVIDSTGKVTAVNPINDYVTGNDTSDLLYP
jgi:uncharacterized protein YfaP (DUF2135 family)